MRVFYANVCVYMCIYKINITVPGIWIGRPSRGVRRSRGRLDQQSWQKFSKVGAVINLLYKVTIGSTFENALPWQQSVPVGREHIDNRRRTF